MELCGILPLRKPQGLTSHDCVMKMRKLLKTKKIGHAGTLDPDVEGVLPLCIGRATKVVEYMHEYPKTYIGEVTLGYSTTTEDRSGEIVERVDEVKMIDRKEIEEVLQSFLGEIEQIPPMYSAVKVKGKKLYEYARANEKVERPIRKVAIYEIQLLNDPAENPDRTISFTFQVTCSKGTYIRTLAVDIGKKLGYPAHMSYLQRIKSGPFSLNDCYTFLEIEQALADGTINNLLYPIEKAIEDFPRLIVDDELEKKIRNGTILHESELQKIDHSRISLYNKEGKCLAIYKEHPTKQGYFKPEKMLVVN